MKIPEGLLYSKEHEWISCENSLCTVGITDYAQSELGDVVYAELPETGQRFEANQTFGSLESVKAVSEIFLPVAGEIAEVNSALLDAPERVNEAPYGDGWLVRVQISDPKELDSLLSAEDYQRFLED